MITTNRNVNTGSTQFNIHSLYTSSKKLETVQ